MTAHALPVIDADAHVIENESTWSFMQPAEERFRPVAETVTRKGEPGRDYWVFDRIRELRNVSPDGATPVATRELIDVAARLAHMDELGIAVHVIYPTIMLGGITNDALAELALRRSYNRWLASRCEASQGRLRWVCLPPLHSMDQALAELRFAKDNGACGVMKKADLETGRWLTDPYFFPLYAEAERLDLPICFHTGTGQPENITPENWLNGRLLRMVQPVAAAVHSLVLFEIPAKFPKLRFGFVEAGAAWLPFVFGNLKRRAEKMTRDAVAYRDLAIANDVMRANRIYVACFVDEDLPYLIQHFGADNLMAGSDYGHGDSAKETSFDVLLRQRAARGDISGEALDKILHHNPKTFYGL